MNTSLSTEVFDSVTRGLRSAVTDLSKRYPGESHRRQPVHTVYGGAHLFKSDTAVRLGSLSIRAFETFAPDPQVFADAIGVPAKLAETVHSRVAEKLAREAV